MKVKTYMIAVYAVLVKNGKREIEELPEAYTQVLAQISYESCPTERIASLSCGTAQSGSSKGKSSMSFWKEPIQSNNQRCDSQNRIVVPNGGYRYPKAKRK